MPFSPNLTTMSLTHFPPFPPSIQTNKLPLFQTTTFYPTHHVKPQSFTILPLKNNPAKTPFHPMCTSPQSSNLYGEESELQEAIVEILLEAGVSREEALQIAGNAPKYGKMVRDGVEDLDELSLWKSWGVEVSDVGPLCLKDKVKYIAREKGDCGKIAYLESVGLSLSSATHLARIVKSQSLSSLIYKVKYVKEIFFSGSADERLAGKLARRMMLHLSISVDDDVQQTLSFFEKIEARRGGLDMLGCSDTSFRYLIESFPRLLLLSVDLHMKPMVKYLENIGVPKDCIRNVLLLFPPLIFLDAKDGIKAGPWTAEKVAPADQELGRMVVKYPWIISASTQKNYKEILSFFETKKVPKVSTDRAIRDWPLLLGCSSDKLKPMVEHFNDLGVSSTKLGKVIATSPQLLLRRPEEFWKVVSFLRDMGFDKDSICKILARCPEIFALRTENILQKKLDFLTGLGIMKQQFPRVLKKYPEFLISDTDRTVMPRLEYLMKSGLSKRDVAFMVVCFSPLLGYSIEEVLRPKLEFLVNTIGKPVKELVHYPRYFSYSLEKKIKPRFLALRGRNLDCSLKDMLSKNDEEFASDYLGIEKMFASIR